MVKGILIRILMALSILALIVICFFLAHEKQKEQKQSAEKVAEYSEVNGRLNELYNQREDLNDRIRKIQRGENESRTNVNILTLVISEPDEELIKDMRRNLDQYSFPVCVCVTEKNFPGEKDCISVQEMQEVIDNGWEFVIAPEKPEDIRKISDKLAGAGLKKATAVYIKKIKDEKILDRMLEAVVNADIHTVFAEQNGKISDTEDYTVIPIKEYALGRISDEKDSLAYIIGPENKDKQKQETEDLLSYDEKTIANKVYNICKMVNEGSFKVCGALEAGESVYNNRNGIGDDLSDEETEIKELESRIDVINAEIESLHNGIE